MKRVVSVSGGTKLQFFYKYKRKKGTALLFFVSLICTLLCMLSNYIDEGLGRQVVDIVLLPSIGRVNALHCVGDANASVPVSRSVLCGEDFANASIDAVFLHMSP